MAEENKIGNISAVEANNQIGIKSDSSPFASTFYFEDYYDDKAIKKFIKNTERLIRQSREYSTYIELLRTNYHQLNRDNILSNINTGDVDLEFHHYPFSLYDILEVLLLQHMINKDKINTFRLAKETMELHYKHLIGLVPLTKTMHEMAHNGNLFISKEQIFGDYQGFMKMFPQAIPQDIKMKITEMEKNSLLNMPSDVKGVL